MKMRFLPDEPITNSLQDVLGFDDFVELIQTSIYNTETPFVYGVLGDWGSGKTSILRLLENRLDKDLKNGAHPFVPIWFNAWEYENEANIVYPLLYAIKRDYDVQVGAFDEAKEFGKKFLQVVATSTLALTDVGLRVATKYLTGEALKLEDVSKHLKSVQEHPGELERVLSGWADEVAGLKDAFEKLLDTYAGELALTKDYIASAEGVRFVILIDDLDRCLPETTIAVLESIKNYLFANRCIFVLGLNPKVIYQGIRIKYKGLEIDGREYLEKIMNYSFYVPEPELDRVATFATSRLGDLVLDDQQREQYRGLFTEFGQVLQACHFNNPRKIKRILNRYLLFISKYGEKYKDYSQNIVRLIVLAEHFSSLFQLFLRHSTTARTAKDSLSKVTNLDFKVQDFEAQFGVSIAAVYPKLVQMSNLFDLKLPTDAAKPDLTEQAKAVFSITRLI